MPKRSYPSPRSTPVKRRKYAKKTYSAKKNWKRLAKAVKSKSFSRSKSSGKLQSVPKRSGNKHWLSYGKSGIFNSKKKPFIGKLSKVLAPQFTVLLNSGAIAPTAGTQSVVIVGDCYTPSDIATYMVSITSPADYHNSRTILNSCNLKTFFTNQENAPVFMDIYDIVARRDIDLMGSATDFTDPASAWSSGTLQESAGSFNNSYIGTTPFLSETFTQFFKVMRVTRINLALGETCEHVTTLKPVRLWNHSIDYHLTTNHSTDNTITLTAHEGAFKNLTLYSLAVVWGCPGDANNTTVGTLAAKVDYVTTKTYKFTQIAVNNTHLDLAGVVTTANQIMNEGTGTATAVAAA